MKHESKKNDHSPKHSENRQLILCVCIFFTAIVWIVFGQTRHFDFVNFDDDQYAYGNTVVSQGLTFHGASTAFSYNAIDNWVPLTTISHMLDFEIYGLKPGEHHLTNIVLHATTAILLFLALRRMTGTLWRSAFVAAVFAVHPLRAESVAWVSERKDVLCGVFFMLTLWAYAGYAQKKGAWWYLAALFSFLLAIMSKPVAVTMPFILLLLDYWPLNRFAGTITPRSEDEARGWLNNLPVPARLAVEKIPFLIVSLASCVPTILSERPGIRTTEGFTIALRIENAIVSSVAYVWQFFYPVNLAAFYPYPESGLPFVEVALALLLLVVISLAAFYFRRRYPYLLVGWFWYLVMLVPVIGLVQVGSQARADRHTYLSEIGLCLLVTWLVADLCTHLRHRVLALGSLSTIVLAVLIFYARLQTSYWKNNFTLWTHAIACTSNNVWAYCDLGHAFLEEKDWHDAIVQYQDALAIDPKNAEAHNNLGTALSSIGKREEAMVQFQSAVESDPKYARAHNNLANAFYQQGQMDKAITQYEEALQIEPENADFHDDLGLALASKGQTDEARAQYGEALKINPNYAEAHYNLGNVLLRTGQVDGAIAQLQEALKINPKYAQAHNNLGNALHREGRVDEAIAQYQEALKINPNYTGACYNLGNALFQKGRINEAVAAYQEALKIQPDNTMLQNNLLRVAWILATSPDASVRNGNKAVELALEANQSTRNGNPNVLRVLAAAYAESGHFPDAIETGKRALALATEQQNIALQSALQQDLSLYQTGSPLRDEAPNATGQ